MAHFYGSIQGNRGEATRCGSKDSGIQAMVKSWKNKATLWLTERGGKDELDINFSNELEKIRINGKEIPPELLEVPQDQINELVTAQRW